VSAKGETTVQGAPPGSEVGRRATARAVLRLATPAIAQSILHTLVFLVDRAMLGRHAAASLASMQISGPVAWATWSTLTAFCVGTVALVGRATGAGDRPLAVAATRASLGWALVTGLLAAGLGIGALDLLLSAFPAAGPEVREAASGYLGIVFGGMPLLMVSYTASAVFTAAGDARTPFFVAAAGNVLNIVLNWVLIFGELGAPELGARGAAIASVSAMALTSVVLLGLMARRGRFASLRGGGGEAAAFRRMLRVAGAAFGERVVHHVGFLGFVAMIGALGALSMAANQALISIESICFLSAEGFGLAAAAIVAQRLGARRPAEAAFGGWVAAAMALALLGACAVAFLLVPELLLSAFTDDLEIVAAGVPCLFVAAAAQPFMAVSIVLAEALRGAGATRVPLVVALIGGLVVRLGATWLLAFVWDLGLIGVWLGSTCDWVVRSALLAYVFLRGRWRDLSI